jgi:sugar lactone lactonase YvrE
METLTFVSHTRADGKTVRPTRRRFIRLASGATLASYLNAAADKESLPVVSKRVEKAFRAPCKAPNDLDATPDGLWILDQVDPNKAYKVRYEDGSVLAEIQTESIHGSGIAFGGGALWVASTWGLKTLKVDPRTGKTLESFDTPGAGMNKFGKPTRPSGAHGLKWVDGKYWEAVPASGNIYLIEPETGKVLRTIPGPGIRTHGLAWDNGHLWCVESIDRAIYKMDPTDGKLLAKIQLTKEDPEPHGLALWKGVFWYCDASSGWVCRLV